jgi:hypothetical protein
MAYPNIAVDSSFYMTFSNVPGVAKDSTLKYYDDYVRSVSLPSYSVNVYATGLLGHNENHPMQRQNDDLGDVSITFKNSEDCMNYFMIMHWMQALRFGVDLVGDTDLISPSGPRLKRNVINEMDVFILDNQKRTIAKVRFTNCLPTDLSGLEFTYGSDEELEFTLTLKYEDILVEVEGFNDSTESCITSSSAASSAT